MAAGDVAAFHRFARAYDLVVPPARRGPLRAGLDRARRPIERVLDVGGGTGRGVRAVEAGERVVIDAAAGMLRRVPAGIGAVRATATDLPVRDSSVDAVLIVDALHHMPDHGRVLAEAARVLRPGGVLVIREFDPATLRGRLLAAAEHLVGFGSTFHVPDRLAKRVGEAGLSPAVLDRGFSFTLVGRKPGGPTPPDTEEGT